MGERSKQHAARCEGPEREFGRKSSRDGSSLAWGRSVGRRFWLHGEARDGHDLPPLLEKVMLG